MIKRYFSDKLNAVRSKTRDVEIRNAKTGEVIYSEKGCAFPENLSVTACDIIASKYFYRGVNEKSYFSLVDRMVSFWAEALESEELLDHEEVEVFLDEAFDTIVNQYWAPNSPQWFNTGLYQAYGVSSDSDGLYHADKNGNVSKVDNDYLYSQASACFILEAEDKLIGTNSITDHYVTETKLFKRGSGTGSNFSKIRAKGERLSSGGTSSGLMSFLEGLDKNAGAIKSGGTTRRAAKMVIVDIDHPEIEDFIEWKVREEEKAKVLGSAGYDMDIGGEAYSTVSGQNSNNSVRISDKFMLAALDDDDWELKGRVDSSVNKTVKASELFENIAKAAWACGDPGVQFDDEFNEWNTCYNSGRINATNPCSEFSFLDNTACNLASINIDKFLVEDGDDLVFNIEAFEKVIRIVQLALEASIYWGAFPTPEIAKNSFLFRPTGLGIANLGKFLNRLGLAYDSDEARLWTSLICSIMTAVSYEVSGDMAERVGTFKEYDLNAIPMTEVLAKHATATSLLEAENSPKLDFLKRYALDKWRRVFEYEGYRNAQVTCIAPTGTISLAMDCETTGIEPYYSRTITKKLADGSVITTENNDVIKTADEIDPIDHVLMVAAIQPFISGAVSKTVNMPEDVSVEDVKNVFVSAWENGCKSITIYRNGSKATQVLNKEQSEKSKTDKRIISPDTKLYFRTADGEGRYVTHENLLKAVDKKINEAVKEALENNKPERQKPDGIRESRTHAAKIGDIELYITIGYYENGDMAEVFISNDKEGSIVRGLLASLSKSISHQFQNGEDPHEIARMLRGQKYEPSGVIERHPYIKFADSISDLVSKIIDIELGDYSRCQVKPDHDHEGEDITVMVTDLDGNVLWRYNEDTEGIEEEIRDEYSERIYGEYCTNCGSDRLVKSGTCKVCSMCGTTTGCS